MKRLALLLLVGVLGLGCEEADPTSRPAQASAALRAASSSRGRASAGPNSGASEPEAPRDTPTAALGERQGAATPSQAPAPRGLAPSEGQARESGGIRGALSEVSAPLRLSTSLEARDGQWVARWTLINEGQEALYVATQLPVQRGGGSAPSPDRLYARARAGKLHLTKRLWRIPVLVQPLVRELPYLERLDPGQSLRGGVRIPPRVATNYPYQPGGAQEGELVREVVISFGYFDASVQPRALASGLYQVPYGAIDQQRYVRSPAHAARLYVR